MGKENVSMPFSLNHSQSYAGLPELGYWFFLPHSFVRPLWRGVCTCFILTPSLLRRVYTEIAGSNRAWDMLFYVFSF
jgi:hypothetical protein